MTRSLPLLGAVIEFMARPAWRARASSYRRRWFTAALATVVMLMGGCGGGGGDGDAAASPTTQVTSGPVASEAPTTEAPSPTPTEEASEDDLTGTWSGTWTSTNPDDGSTGTFEIQWAQAGSNLAGTITVNGTPCLSTGAITGTLAGDAIEFGSIQSQFNVDFTGTVAGEAMAGTYSTTCGPAEGDWEATNTG